AQEEVVVRPADRHRLAAERLRQQRVADTPQDGQAERDQQQVVVQEGRLARDGRLEPRPRPQERKPPEDEPEAAGGDQTDEAEEPWADRALREGVDRVDDARASEERAED